MRIEFSMETMLSQLREMVAEVKLPNRSVLPRLKEYLSSNPEIWEEMEIVGKNVEGKWIDLLVGDRDDLRERLRDQIDGMKREYRHGGSTPLVRIMVDRVVITWLMVWYFDAALALASEAKLTKQVRFFNQQASRAQQRFARAVKSLLEVRKLMGGVESER